LLVKEWSYPAVVRNGLKHQNDFSYYIGTKTGEVEQETGKNWKNEKKLKKSGREVLFHYFNMGKSNLVFHTVSNNSWFKQK
jgi:hypothetical protein